MVFAHTGQVLQKPSHCSYFKFSFDALRTSNFSQTKNTYYPTFINSGVFIIYIPEHPAKAPWSIVISFGAVKEMRFGQLSKLFLAIDTTFGKYINCNYKHVLKP